MLFNEANLEAMILGLIKKKGHEYTKGTELNKKPEEVLLEDDMRKFLESKYASYGITPKEITKIINDYKAIPAVPLYDSNKKTFKKMIEGEVFQRDIKAQKPFLLQMIDFENIENNIIRVCNQVTIKGHHTKRVPDMIVYINGIPMIVCEYKSAIRESATIYDAYVQLTTRYVRDIPELLKYNAFVVISDGVNTKMGSVFTDYEHFYSWRREGEESEDVDGSKSLYSMINGLFRRDRLLDFIHNFICFPDDGVNKELKIVASCHQYFAVNGLYSSILAQIKPNGNGLGGTYFGTTGCGKSYIMLFLARKLVRSKELNSPTINLITDRVELDEQLAELFMRSKEFLGENDVSCVESREDLRIKLKDKISGGVYLTTIHKFTSDLALLSDRNNIICISDEAHRSQLNLDPKMTFKEDEVVAVYGFAKYLHDALPNATYVGFTGTPIKETTDVFGPVVEQYTMSDSIKDGITVPFFYDNKFVKIGFDEEHAKKIDQYCSNSLKSGANKYQVEEAKKFAISIRDLIGNEKRLRRVAEMFIECYENAIKENSTVAGKCMYVCADRLIAYNFYKILAELQPDWIIEKKCSEELHLSEKELEELKPMPRMKLIMTRDKDDPEELYDLIGSEADRVEATRHFKDVNSNFKIAIVVDMWLTGFDVPFLDTIYIDKPFAQAHGIIQAISRVNRAYKGKTHGRIVDFIGIKDDIENAFSKYVGYDNNAIEGIEQAIKVVKDELQNLNSLMADFDSNGYFNGNGEEQFRTINEAVEFLQYTKDSETRFMAHAKHMLQAFNLCNSCRDFTPEELEQIYYFKSIKSVLFKLTKGDAPDLSQMTQKVKEMVQDAILVEDSVSSFTLTNDSFEDSTIFFDENYLNMLKQNENSNLNSNFKISYQLAIQDIEKIKTINRVKSKSFSETLQSIVEKYNLRQSKSDTIESLNEISKLLKDIKEEEDKSKKLGIDYKEKAIIDILMQIEKEHNIRISKRKNLELVKEICKAVAERTKDSNWKNRADIKAKLKVDILKILYKHDSEIYQYHKEIGEQIVAQVENFEEC